MITWNFSLNLLIAPQFCQRVCVCAAVGFSVVLHFTAIPKCVLHSWRNVMRYRCVFRVAHKNCTIRLLVKVHTLTHWILGIKLRADESNVPYPCFASCCAFKLRDETMRWTNYYLQPESIFSGNKEFPIKYTNNKHSHICSLSLVRRNFCWHSIDCAPFHHFYSIHLQVVFVLWGYQLGDFFAYIQPVFVIVCDEE